jgi:hypothetical protein
LESPNSELARFLSGYEGPGVPSSRHGGAQR